MSTFEVFCAGAQLARYLPGMLTLAQAEQQHANSLMIAHGPEFYTRYQGDDGETCVALAGDSIAGYSLLADTPRLHAIWHPRAKALGLDQNRCGCLVQVMVAAKVRGQGLSSALVEATLEAAKRRGIEHLFTSVAPDNTASVRMVERGGFRRFEVAKVYCEQVIRALFHCEVSRHCKR